MHCSLPRPSRIVPRKWLCLLILCLAGTLGACIEQGTIKVAHLKFTGVKAVKESQLRSILATVQSSRLPWGSKHYFSREQFDADLKRVSAFYKDRGYPDSKVKSFDVKLNKDQDAVDVTLNVDEGQPILVQQIEYNGFDVIPAQHFTGLKARVPQKTNAPLDRALAQASREAALDEVKDHGYPYATVRITERPGKDDHSKILTLTATPGTEAHYGNVEIAGNTSVSDHVVQRQLTFRPGQLYRTSQLQESQRRLYALETFQFANIEGETKEGEQPPVIPVKVTLTEGKHRKVNFGVGYGSEEHARASIDWRHVNFFGGARTMQIETKYSSLSRGVRANFRQPYLFSPKYDLLISTQDWHNAEPFYTMDTRGARVTVEHVIAQSRAFSQQQPSNAVSLTYTNEYQRYQVADFALVNPKNDKLLISLGLDPLNGKAHGLLSSLDLDLHRSTADSALNAQHGYVANVHLEQAGRELGGSYDFVETIFEGRYYRPIANKVLVAVRARGGSIGSPSGQNLKVPFFRRYWLGGASSLRGWGRFEVAPLFDGRPIGGHTMFESSTEFRAPLWRSLAGVVFMDAGNVWNDAWRYHMNDLRYDVGPGLRYMTPIGPFRVDLGYQLNPIPGLLVNGKPQPRRFRLHFSIGQAF